MGNHIWYKSMPYFGWFHPFLTFEHHCLAYRSAGNKVSVEREGWDIESYGDGIRSTERTRVIRTAYFARHHEYPKNILFMLIELLISLMGWIRFIFEPLALGACLFVILVFQDDMFLGKVLLGILISYGISLGLSILAVIVRKIFQLDRKIDDICDENNWQRWSDYRDRDFR